MVREESAVIGGSGCLGEAIGVDIDRWDGGLDGSNLDRVGRRREGI